MQKTKRTKKKPSYQKNKPKRAGTRSRRKNSNIHKTEKTEEINHEGRPVAQLKSFMKEFLQRQQKNLCKELKQTQLENIQANVLPPSAQWFAYAGSLIRNEELVAFPTETVYGLGADATSEKALLSIYKTKRRPLTDPIIVHVLSVDSALELVEIRSEQQKMLFIALANMYWPGPLTMIVKANTEKLPLVVTAQTGFVGIRSPRNEDARKLLEHSQRPIGAPSANLFGHVSPTTSTHVLNDFFNQNVNIIDGERCEYGIQSTVIKIVTGSHIQIFREGSLSTFKLKQFLHHTFGESMKIEIVKNVKDKNKCQNMEAPGQLLKHYSPNLPCYYVKEISEKAISLQDENIPLSSIAMISFSEKFSQYSEKFKYFFEVEATKEENKNQKEKYCDENQKARMKEVYYLLRKCENLDVSGIIIGWGEDESGTIWDKIFRATEGKQAQLR